MERMADLTYDEKNQLERLFSMGGGYVLEFSNWTFQQFVEDAVRINIDDARYAEGPSGSKANRLRMFWKIESNATVARLLDALIKVAARSANADCELIDECRGIAERLRQLNSVDDLVALDLRTGDYGALFSQIRHAVQGDEPEAALDRLHTFMVRFGRHLCAEVGVDFDRNTPLHAVLGGYVRKLRELGYVQAKMTQSILKAAVNVLDAFNDVRNNHTLAHDNPTLNRSESLLIVNHISSTVRFLRDLDERVRADKKAASRAVPDDEDDLPF
jgi:hypothetical protein